MSDTVTAPEPAAVERSNPLRPVYAECNVGNSHQKWADLPEFPRLIDIEATNACNFRCLMCPTGNKSMRRKTGFMEDDTYYRILEEITPHKTPLRFIQWGEPLMHPRIDQYLADAHAAGVMTHLNTNGSYLDRDRIEALIATGLDSLKFSFQGVDRKSYQEMRQIDFFDGLIDTMRLFHEVRGNRAKPFVHVSTTITYETPDQVAYFKELVAPFVDLVTVGRTMLGQIDLTTVRLRPSELETLKWLQERESLIKVHPECPEVYDKLSINWDGSVAACCADADKVMVIGNVKDTTLAGLWRSDQMEHYRAILADMGHDKLPLCKNCYDYQSTTVPGVQNT